MALARPWRLALITSICLITPPPAQAFIEELFGQAFGGGGGRGRGGGGFQFQMGDGGQMFEMGGGHRQPQKPKWPRGTPTEIGKKFAWMKGTEWNWNNWRHVKFNKDGSFEAPTGDCQQGMCLWSAGKGKVYILWGEAGLHELKLSDQPKDSQPQSMQGIRMEGTRHDGEKCFAIFHRVFDHEAADLDKDLYEILGLKDDDDESDIKKVYRKLSMKYHPDKIANPTEETQRKFNEIRDAYEILNDPDTKILYDTGGMEAVKKHQKGEVAKGDNIGVELAVTLEDLYNRNVVKAPINRRVVCRGCRTRPDSPKCKGCNRCPNEIRTVNQQVGPGMFMQREQEVQSKEKCKQEQAIIEVPVEKGMKDGESLSFERMAEQRPGMLPGAVVYTLKAAKHPKFRRTGDDLHMDMQVSLRESLLGWAQSIRHLDGHILELKTDSVTKPFQVFQVKGEGMPLRDDPSSRGNLNVKVEVAFPKSMTPEQQQEVDAIFAKTQPREEL
jgi:DnaJ-class molecular chaperone